MMAKNSIDCINLEEVMPPVDEIPRSLNNKYGGLEVLTCVHNHGVTVIEI